MSRIGEQQAEARTQRRLAAEADVQRRLATIRALAARGDFEVALVFGVTFLVETAKAIARRHGIKHGTRKSSLAMLDQLGFQGILSPDLLEQALHVVSKRDSLLHTAGEVEVGSDDVACLIQAYEGIGHLL